MMEEKTKRRTPKWVKILAIVLFRDRVQELWTAIADGINSL